MLVEPKRGEVIVFRYPPQPTISYIKRVVGLPGDHIQFKDGQLIINGQKLQKLPLQLNVIKTNLKPNRILFKETLGEHQHLTVMDGRNPLAEQFHLPS